MDIGASATPERLRIDPPGAGGLPPIVAQNAAAAGTDILGYLTESPAVSVFMLVDGTVYQTYAATWRGIEFLMNYYPALDRVPKGRDEGDAWQTWIRRPANTRCRLSQSSSAGRRSGRPPTGRPWPARSGDARAPSR